MDVVFDVATETTRRQHIPIFDRVEVAQDTGLALMLTVKREFSSGIVIKGPILPGTGVVTLAALGSQGLLVLVVLQVAGDARNLRVLEFCTGCVTLCARQRRMFSQ